MAVKAKTDKKSVNTSTEGRTNRETTQWMVGFVLIVLGVISIGSVLSYYIHWKADFSLLNGIGSDNPNFDLLEYTNHFGSLGAWIGEVLVGRSFGLFGIAIPIFIFALGVRVVCRVPLKLNHMALTTAFVLLLGSLTLGFAFADSFDLFNSGLGGKYGIEMAKVLHGVLGVFGTAIILIGGWIGFGVFVNRNFINTVNAASQSAVNKGGKIVGLVKDKVVSRSKVIAEEDYEGEPSPLYEEPSQQPTEPTLHVSEDEDRRKMESFEIEYAEDAATAMAAAAAAAAAEKEDEEDFEIIHPTENTQQQGADDLDMVIERFDNEAEAMEVVDLNPVTERGLVVTVVDKPLEQLSEEQVDELELYDPLKDLHNYTRPSVNLLEDYKSASEVTDEEIYENKSKIEDTLKHFGIPIQKIKATVGPTITLYEIVQAQGVKISKIQGLENDIAQSLKALGIRIIAPIPGRGTIGIEVPNRNKQVVSMLSSVRSTKFQESKAELPIVIGRNIQNEDYVFDLAKMPHLLVAGATGQGKSVGLNAIITSLLYRKHPAELKFVMIDPKMVEFTPYKNLERHFIAKMESEDDVIITDPKKAVYTLNALCEEMEKRLKLLSKAAVRNIVEYNQKFTSRHLNPDKGHFYMPYIVVVVDEFADLIMMTREVEAPVMRLAQKARAVGIHLIIATQRPDVKVITGGIKANFPARIAFRVMQMIDSRTIIDQPGANQLIGRGDMLFSKDGELTRIQCALVETDEVSRIVNHISSQQGYGEAYRLPDYAPDSGDNDAMGSESGAPIKYDSLFAEVARAAVAGGGISTSAIQRNYEVGFNRAGRIMMQLEKCGIVGKQEGAKPREIYFHDQLSIEAKLQELGIF